MLMRMTRACSAIPIRSWSPKSIFSLFFSLEGSAPPDALKYWAVGLPDSSMMLYSMIADDSSWIPVKDGSLRPLINGGYLKKMKSVILKNMNGPFFHIFWKKRVCFPNILKKNPPGAASGGALRAPPRPEYCFKIFGKHTPFFKIFGKQKPSIVF